jgi:hypothetical protein
MRFKGKAANKTKMIAKVGIAVRFPLFLKICCIFVDFNALACFFVNFDVFIGFLTIFNILANCRFTSQSPALPRFAPL